MKPRFLVLLLTLTVLSASACSPFAITSSSGGQPEPILEVESPSTGYQDVVVDNVEVKLGQGSPMPVHVRVGAQLPDPCSQVEYTEIRRDGSSFVVQLSASPVKRGCSADTLPFTMSIPLNVVGLAAGSYTVTVNGVRADFALEGGDAAGSIPAAGGSYRKADIQVDQVTIETGLGSPIPVHAAVSGNLPAACAYLGEVRVHLDEKAQVYFVRLVAYIPEQQDCLADSLPFRLYVPLNTVNLRDGSYAVNVNGTGAGFSLPLGQ